MNYVWNDCELILIVKASVEIPCEAGFRDVENVDVRVCNSRIHLRFSRTSQTKHMFDNQQFLS
jgi:hypothetical protein